MADPTTFHMVKEGMQVKTSDGTTLGKVRAVHFGQDTTGERHSIAQVGMREIEDTTELSIDEREGIPDAVVEVEGSADKPTLYIPHQAVYQVDEQTITLYVDINAVEASDWATPPSWLSTV